MEKRILKKLEAHDLRFDQHDQKFKEHDQRFDLIDQKLDKHGQRLDKLTIAVVDIQEEIVSIKETMATKEDIRGLAVTLDDLVGLYKKSDQELTFMGHRLDRVEDDVSQLKAYRVG